MPEGHFCAKACCKCTPKPDFKLPHVKHTGLSLVCPLQDKGLESLSCFGSAGWMGLFSPIPSGGSSCLPREKEQKATPKPHCYQRSPYTLRMGSMIVCAKHRGERHIYRGRHGGKAGERMAGMTVQCVKQASRGRQALCLFHFQKLRVEPLSSF